jgi:hypothetical protein
MTKGIKVIYTLRAVEELIAKTEQVDVENVKTYAGKLLWDNDGDHVICTENTIIFGVDK